MSLVDLPDLESLLGYLPAAAHLHVWGDPAASQPEREAIHLAQALTGRFPKLSYQSRPRRANYDYYPVIGVMGDDEGRPVDGGLRLIGCPVGYQITSLVGAIQAVVFRGSQLEGRTRIQLSRLKTAVNVEVITAAEDDVGPLVATMAFNMAAASLHVRSYLIMGDQFPQALTRYSVQRLPHTVLNGRVHVVGLVDEEAMMRQVARAVKSDE
ncbi:MAG: thioredoxin family protein [Chloroflexota bacterium]